MEKVHWNGLDTFSLTPKNSLSQVHSMGLVYCCTRTTQMGVNRPAPLICLRTFIIPNIMIIPKTIHHLPNYWLVWTTLNLLLICSSFSRGKWSPIAHDRSSWLAQPRLLFFKSVAFLDSLSNGKLVIWGPLIGFRRDPLMKGDSDA